MYLVSFSYLVHSGSQSKTPRTQTFECLVSLMTIKTKQTIELFIKSILKFS